MEEKKIKSFSEFLQERYPVGTRVRLSYMRGLPSMKRGTEGVITLVDEEGQIHVRWETGLNLALHVNHDEFEVI